MTIKAKHEWWQSKPFCYWCGIKTRWLKERVSKPGQYMPFNSFTIDHLLSSWDEKRIRLSSLKKEIPKVTSCLDCNNKRGSFEFHRLPLFKMLEVNNFYMTLWAYLRKKLWFYRKIWFTSYFEQFQNKSQYLKKLYAKQSVID